MWKMPELLLHFTRAERNAGFVLLLGALVFLVSPAAYHFFSPAVVAENAPDNRQVRDFIAAYRAATEKQTTETAQAEYNPYDHISGPVATEATTRPVPEPFDFDPNTIGVQDWVKLGFSEKQAAAIERYKAAGGKFYHPEDLRKIYVVSEKDYKRLAPHIHIARTAFTSRYPVADTTSKSPLRFELDINTADSASFEHLRGIGPALARRIIRYRERLGGFVSVHQISEVWGLPDSTYRAIRNKLKVEHPHPAKINLNSADETALRQHPYINYTLARVMYNYRLQHGPYQEVSDLKQLVPVTDSIYQKLWPYLAVE